MKEAKFYKKTKNNTVKCELCYQSCTIKPGSYGLCLARKNKRGILYSIVYGKIAGLNVDFIEKKPLYHFQPGSKSYSIGTTGCNFKCKFCQNADISQVKLENFPFVKELTPEEAVKDALRNDCKSISYTYNEPTINYEFALETAKLAKKKGLKNVFVTNACIQKKPLEVISPYLDAANIDLKSMNENFYRKICKADLKKVLNTIKEYYKLKIHIELTTLIIPGLNDSNKQIKKICEWVLNNLDKNVPLHFSRFYPQYLMKDKPITSIETIKNAVKTAKQLGIKYAYAGNVIDRELNNTYCHNCGEEIIDRTGSTTIVKNLKKYKCEKCKTRLLLHY